MSKCKYAKQAHEITQNYIETYGAHFINIDDLNDAIASALRETVERTALPCCFTASTYGVMGYPEKAQAPKGAIFFGCVKVKPLRERIGYE